MAAFGAGAASADVRIDVGGSVREYRKLSAVYQTKNANAKEPIGVRVGKKRGMGTGGREAEEDEEEEEEANWWRIMTAVWYQAVIFPGHHSRHARNVDENREHRAIGIAGGKSNVAPIERPYVQPLEKFSRKDRGKNCPGRKLCLTPSTFSLISRPAAASNARRIEVAVPVCLDATTCTAVCCLGCSRLSRREEQGNEFARCGLESKE